MTNDILNPDFILSGTPTQVFIKIWLPVAQYTWKGDVVELEEFLKKAKQIYYLTDSNLIEDADYDTLEVVLKELKPDSTVLTGIGLLEAPEGDKVKVSHGDRPMGSLNKIKTEEEADKFLKDFPDELYVAMCKLDGCSLSLIYVDGKLKQAKTRGNGDVGEDVTHNALVIPSIPKTVKKHFTGEVRGEGMVFKADFERINAQRLADKKKPFANPRNMAAGALGQKRSEECAERCVSFVAYNIFPTESDIEFMSDRLNELSALGFIVTPLVKFINSGTNAMDVIHANFPLGKDFGFDTDGVVLMPDAVSYWEIELGNKHNRPCYAVAWKWEAETKTSTVIDIKWETGKTGKVTPVIQIIPVNLSGANIENVTGYNAKFIQTNEIGPDAEVIIQRANEVIPKCLGTVKRSQRWSLPTHCPACKSLLEFDDIQLWCRNTSCESRVTSRILRFVKKMDMKGFGDAIIESLVEEGIIRDPCDLFLMWDNYDEDILAMVVGGHGILSNLKKTIQIRKNTPISEVDIFSSIGIDNVSDGTCERILEKYHLSDIPDICETTTRDGFCDIRDIGEATSIDIVVGVKRYRYEIMLLMKLLKVVREEKKVGKLTGKKFCITGTLSQKREVVEQAIENLGGEISGVKKDPEFYLILGADGEGSSKWKKATQLGANIISEDELNQMLTI